MARTATVVIRGLSPLSQSKAILSERGPNEQHSEFEKRTWRERIHADEETGICFNPPMAFKNCLSEAAKYLSMKVPGKRNATYTKHFEAGIYIDTPLFLGQHVDSVKSELLFVPSDGVRGGGKRVYKYFPVFREWGGEIRFTVLDDIITEEAFKTHLQAAGAFKGVGRFRPGSNGYYGRFEVVSIKWS
jgi:hypothetical protein